MKKALTAVLLAASALLSTHVAHATAYDTYSNHDDFVGDVSGLNTYTFGPISGSIVPHGHSWTLGTIGFNSESTIFLEKDGKFGGATSLLGTGDDLEITPAGGKAIGFFLTSAGNDNEITFNLNDLGPRTITLNYTDGIAFFGLYSGRPIESVVFSGYGGELHLLDLETNGSFIPQVAATPEPSSLALLGTGVLSVGGMVRRRFKRA